MSDGLIGQLGVPNLYQTMNTGSVTPSNLPTRKWQ